jgi:group I intron endonuclease
MQTIYGTHANQSGIYRIINTKNGRIYIGSTRRFKGRARSHRADLEASRHKNTYLQNDFNKCGSECFIFEVLEVTESKAEMLLREQYWIDQLYDNQKNCYNFRKDAADSRAGRPNKQKDDPTTSKRCGKRLPEDNVKQKAAVQRYFAEEYSKEDREQRREAIQKHHEEHGKYLGLILTHMEAGEQVEVKGSLRTFCKERGLNYKAFHLLVKGKIKSSNGWFVGTEKPVYVERKGEKRKPLSKEHREKIAKGRFEGIVLVNDRGETLTLSRNIKQQAREFGLYYTTLLKVIHKETKSVGGWRLASQPSSPTAQTSS